MNRLLILFLLGTFLLPLPLTADTSSCFRFAKAFFLRKTLSPAPQNSEPNQIVLRQKKLADIEDILEHILRNGPEKNKVLAKIAPNLKESPRSYEWGIAFDRDKQDYVLVLGDKTHTNENGRAIQIACIHFEGLGNIYPIAHSHPPTSGAVSNPVPLEDCLEVYGPSGNDIAYLAKRKVPNHKVLIPVTYTRTGETKLATAESKDPLIHFEIKNAELYGTFKKGHSKYITNEVDAIRQVYVADIVTKVGEKTLSTRRSLSIVYGNERIIIPESGKLAEFLLKGREWEYRSPGR